MNYLTIDSKPPVKKLIKIKPVSLAFFHLHNKV